MKILIYGEFWLGTMADLLKNVFETKGHKVQVLDFTKYLWRASVRGIAGKVLDRLLRMQAVGRINSEFLKLFEEFGPNVTLVSKGVHVLPSTLRHMRAKGCLLANWNPDDFLNPLNSSRQLRSAIQEYDYLFSSRPHLFEEYKQVGARKCIEMDWYYDPIYHRKVDLEPIWEGLDCRSDISFVGSYSRYREERISALKGLEVKVWGAHWNKTSRQFRRNFLVMDKVLPSIELPRVIRHSSINLNILTRENRDTTNLKLFEIAACGGLILGERTSESQSILKEGVDAYYFGNDAELRTVAEGLLNDERARLSVAKHGYQTIIQNGNTLKDRADQLLRVFENHAGKS
jgi:spore maturation protein CgeB